jgi:hypothetical protein
MPMNPGGNPSNPIDTGIGLTARQSHSFERPTGNAQYQQHGMHVGIVVDDIDEMKMNRVWVYIPGVSAYNPNVTYARYTNTRMPMNSDGSPGAQIPSMRTGFMLAHPTTPFSGSDKTREPTASDGRQATIGQSNSYGFHSQPRNGDMLMITFAGGSPANCFFTGHVPKSGENDMIPGLTPGTTQASGAGYSTNVGPAMVQADSDTMPRAQTVFFQNITDSGLIQDPLRGAGTSSATRESPSRVTGIKTAGDPDSLMMGHQLVLDDHPDSQLVRLRTSKGFQVLLCDTGNFIYIGSATGKTWFEMDDSGNVHVYAASSINYHAAQDFNLFCDRDFNLHVGGNSNWITEGDTRIRMSGGGDITVGEGSGDLNITTINNLMVKTQGEIRMGALTGITAFSQQFLQLQSAQNMNFKSAKDLDAQTTGGNFNLKISGTVNMKSGSDFNMDTGGNMNATKNSLNINDITDGNQPNQASIPLQHSVMMGPQTGAPPTSPQGVMQSAAAIVPQHEPWLGHVGQNPGHNAAVAASSIPTLNI